MRATQSYRAISNNFIDTPRILVQHLHALAKSVRHGGAGTIWEETDGLVKLAAAALAAGATFFAFSARADGISI